MEAAAVGIFGNCPSNGFSDDLKSDSRVGPRCIQDWFKWPLEVMQSLSAEEQARALRLLQGGIDVVSSYTGQGSPEIACCMLRQGLAATGYLPSGSKGFTFVEACDKARLCQTVLQAFEGDAAPQHIFCDMMEKLCAPARQEMKELLPSKSEYASDPEAVAQKHSQIEQALERRLAMQVLFAEDGVRCIKHSSQCPSAASLAQATHRSKQQSHGDKTLRMFVAGVTCVDVSTFGRRRHHLGPHHPALLVWLMERRTCREDFGILECTPELDIGFLEKYLSELYELFPLTLSPKDLGVFCDRQRLFIVFISRATMLCLCDQGSFKATFLSKFGRRPPDEVCDATTMRGDMFLCAPEPVVASSLARAALDVGLDMPATWRQTLSAACLHRLQGFEDDHIRSVEALTGLDLEHVKTHQLEEPRLYDITQNCEQRNRSSANLNTLLRRTKYWSAKKQRPMLGLESLVAQGVPVFPEVCSHGGLFECPYASVLHKLSDGQLRSLAGNAICVPIFGHLVAFVLANVVQQRFVTLAPLPLASCEGADVVADDANSDNTGRLVEGVAQSKPELEEVRTPCKRPRLSSGD